MRAVHVYVNYSVIYVRIREVNLIVYHWTTISLKTMLKYNERKNCFLIQSTEIFATKFFTNVTWMKYTTTS